MSRRILVDAVGVEHAPAAPGARIVSLVPSITELLFHLGLGDRVVGRTTFCIHPADALALVPRVGGTKTLRMDKLEALAPTHVIVNVDENRREDVEAMAAFVPHIIVTHPLAPDDNLALYRLMGGIFGEVHAAEELCGAFERARDALVAAAATMASRRVLYLIWREPWMTVSRDTYISRTLALAGLDTIEYDPQVRYPQLRADAELLAETDAVLFSSEPFPFKQAHVHEFRRATGNDAIPFLFIDGEMTSWYGSRAVRGLSYLQAFAAALQ